MRRLFFISGFLISLAGYSQCVEKINAFQPGEKIYYEVYYELGILSWHAAEAYFEVQEDVYNGKECFHFISYGRSLPGYDWLYKVRDSYEAWSDKNDLKSYKYIRNTNEGNYHVRNEYHFDHKEAKIYSFTENSKKPYSEDTLLMPECTNDLVTAVYYTRNIDYSKATTGQKFPVRMIVDNELVDLYIRYLGKEKIETRDGTEFNCVVFTALMMEGSIFNGGEDIKVWVTDDLNRIPVKVEAQILIGTVDAYLTKTAGLKNELSSKIDEE